MFKITLTDNYAIARVSCICHTQSSSQHFSVPDGSRPSHSHHGAPAWLCGTGGSRSRRCRPLSAQCGKEVWAHGGPYNQEMPPKTTASKKNKKKTQMIRFKYEYFIMSIIYFILIMSLRFCCGFVNALPVGQCVHVLWRPCGEGSSHPLP